jgi:hypothetical protein
VISGALSSRRWPAPLQLARRLLLLLLELGFCPAFLTRGPEHDEAQAMLCSRYPQLRPMDIARHPVIAIQVETVRSWGNLSVAA